MKNSFKLGNEIDLLSKYPKAKRDLNSREQSKSEEVRTIARRFGKDFLMEIDSLGTEDLVIMRNIGKR